MGVYWGPQQWWKQLHPTTPGIITEGLVLNLDAGNPSSYSGTGTTWYDLSGNGNNGTLVNGVSYDPANQGSLVFDGVNDYVETNFIQPLSDFTILCWFKKIDDVYWSPIFGTEIWNNGSGYIFYFNGLSSLTFSQGGGGQSLTADPSTFGSIYDFNYYAVTVNSMGDATIFVNGQIAATGSISLASQIEKSIIIGGRHSNDGNSTTDLANVQISNFSFYDRVLTQQEVEYNYNVLKSRYGLIVTDGLILNLDVGNPASYPGSGTTLYDISGNTNIATLYNATYNSENQKSFVFNGSNSYALTNNNSLTPYVTGTDISHFIWVYPTSPGQIVVEYGQYGGGGWHDSNIEINSNGAFSFSTWPGLAANKVTSANLPFNHWYYVGFTYNGTNLTAYVNGESIGTITINREAPGDLYYALFVADSTNMGTFGYGGGKFSVFSVYNKALTQQEITQNYNALKGRFGL